MRASIHLVWMAAALLHSVPSQAFVNCGTYASYSAPSPTYPCNYSDPYSPSCTTACGDPSDTTVNTTEGPGGVCSCSQDTYVYPNSQTQYFDPDTYMPTYDSGCTLPGGQSYMSKTCSCNLTCPADKVLDNSPNCECVEIKFNYTNYWTSANGVNMHLIGEPETLTVTNNGAKDATGCSIIVTDHAGHPGSSSHFTITQNSPSCVGTIPKGGSCNFNIQSPATNSGWVIDLQVSCSNGSSVPGSITATDDYAGGGAGGVIPEYTAVPSSYAFGNVNVGLYSPVQTIAINNSNGVRGYNCSASFQPQPGTTDAADFEVTNDCFSGDETYQTGCHFYITANPQTPGPKAMKIAYTCALAGGGNYLETGYTYTATGIATPTPDPGTGVGGSCTSCPSGSTYDTFIGKCSQPADTGVSGSTINSCTCSNDRLTYDSADNNCSMVLPAYTDVRLNPTGKCPDLTCPAGTSKYYALEPDMYALGSRPNSVKSTQNYYTACQFYEQDQSGSFPNTWLVSLTYGVWCSSSSPSAATYQACSSNGGSGTHFMSNTTYYAKKSLGCGVMHPYNWDPSAYFAYVVPNCPLGTSQYGQKCVAAANCLNALGCPAGFTLSGTKCVEDCPPVGPTPTPAPANLVFTNSNANMAFGDVYVGTDSVTQNVRFTNSSTFAATGCSLAITGAYPGEFSYTGSCPTSLAPGSYCDLVVKGHPNSLGSKSADLSLSCTGDQLGGSVSTHLTELGQNPPALALSITTKDFGSVLPGTSATLAVTVTNTGTLTASSCVGPTLTENTDFSLTSNTCSSTMGPGNSCTFVLNANSPSSGSPTTYATDINIKCTGTTSPQYTGAYDFEANGTNYHFISGSVCTILGQFDTGSGCQCPVKYEITDIGGGVYECRPIVPSFEYYKKADGTSNSYPVCGAGRIPTTTNYGVYQSSSRYTPQMASSVTNVTTGYVYPFATDGVVAPTPHPVYGYADMDRCVCTANTYVPPMVPAGSGAGLLLNATDPAFTASGQNRFLPDTYETISQQTRSGLPLHGAVAIANDGASNGFLGSLYGDGLSSCGCPNINEKAQSIDPSYSSQSGSVCVSMMGTDANTNNFKILTTFNKTLHSAQTFSEPAATAVNSVVVPSQSGTTYQPYKRRIWTCAPPFEPTLSGGTITCQFVASHNTCDDGTASGTVSVVSGNVTGATAVDKFRNTVNKRLACCMNQFDPSNPTATQKFDCVDNSAVAGDFDTLWRSGIDGAPNAVALTNSSGNMMSGFYSLNGARCGEFSEFAGAIRPAKVNQAVTSGQQTSAGGTLDKTAIVYSGVNIAQPSFVTADPKWAAFVSGKSIPSTAEQMRRCPILVRAAIRTKCPGDLDPTTKAYPATPNPNPIQSFNDGTVTRCAVAGQVDVVLRVEQIYEIAGLANMKTIDDSSDYANQATHLQVGDLIRNKTAGVCPGGAILTANGDCAYQ